MAKGRKAPGGSHRAIVTSSHFPTHWLEEVQDFPQPQGGWTRHPTGAHKEEELGVLEDGTQELTAQSLGAGQRAEGPQAPAIFDPHSPTNKAACRTQPAARPCGSEK